MCGNFQNFARIVVDSGRWALYNKEQRFTGISDEPLRRKNMIIKSSSVQLSKLHRFWNEGHCFLELWIDLKNHAVSSAVAPED